ncbi:HEAT repeat domain-containing protein, partial [bacterium]|nr:HEAT repeat domain-containing protein [bacterium]
LDTNNDEIREKICHALGEIGDPSVIKSLFILLEKGNEPICNKAKNTIQKVMTESEVGFLIDKLKTDDEDLRKRICDILFNRRDVSYPMIKKVFKDDSKHKNIRITAIEIIQKVKDAEVVDDLIELLEDRFIAPYAIHALGVIGDEKVIALLLERVNDDNVLIARESSLALGKFLNPEALKYYRVFGPLYSNKTFNEVKRLILDHGESIKEPLLLALSCKNEKVQKAVAKLFGELGEQGIQWIDEELDFRSDESLYNGAVLALGEINLPSAVKSLEKMLFKDDKELKLKTVESLKKNDDITAKIYSIIYEFLYLQGDINKLQPYKEEINIPLTKILDYEQDFEIKQKVLTIFSTFGNRQSVYFLEKLWQMEMYKKKKNQDYILELEVAVASLKKKFDVT